MFHRCISDWIRKLRSSNGWKGTRLVLLIDEFTELFKQIKRGRVQPEIMKEWKAILEKRYFSSILVGQDIMPMFKAEFPNEFGVTEDQRVTYFSEEEARKMIEVPVGAQHYGGNAVNRILELTACSPYYTMMLCKRLVDYINRTKSVVVTEADVEEVKNSIVTGKDRLLKDKFENLVSAGDGKQDTGIDPQESWEACATIAKRSENGWCLVEHLSSDARILEDLENRDVLERKQNSYRIRVGLFHAWLCENQ
jgi:hypothetical protein